MQTCPGSQPGTRAKIGLLLAACCIQGGAQAQIYICKDASGRTLTSDRPISECADRVVHEMSRTGVMVREIPAPLTAEQKRQREIDEEARKLEITAAAAQRHADRALMSRYATEKDIEAARGRALENLRDQDKSARAALALATEQKKVLEAQAEAGKGKAGVTINKRRIEEAEQAILNANEALADNQGKVKEVTDKFDHTLQRFRHLSNKSNAGR